MTHNQKLYKYLDELESFIPEFKEKNPKVSKSNIGWQIDHSLKVIITVLNQLQSAPIGKSSKITLLGHFCLITGFIPRGKGKAPKVVLPPEIIEEKDLMKQLNVAKKLVSELSTVNKKAIFKHPFFGILRKKQTLRFVEVHTKHHLKIIDDILTSNG